MTTFAYMSEPSGSSTRHIRPGLTQVFTRRRSCQMRLTETSCNVINMNGKLRISTGGFNCAVISHIHFHAFLCFPASVLWSVVSFHSSQKCLFIHYGFGEALLYSFHLAGSAVPSAYPHCWTFCTRREGYVSKTGLWHHLRMSPRLRLFQKWCCLKIRMLPI